MVNDRQEEEMEMIKLPTFEYCPGNLDSSFRTQEAKKIKKNHFLNAASPIL
jgi:hypothetical protein